MSKLTQDKIKICREEVAKLDKLIRDNGKFTDGMAMIKNIVAAHLNVIEATIDLEPDRRIK